MATHAEKAGRILAVDDNEANRLLAKNTLEDEGYEVILAAGGAEAIAAFEREAPDCLVLDVRMPEVDGFAVCERIRALPQGTGTPVIFLTALRDVDTFDHALRVGGDDFLTKPIRPTELIVRVQNAVKLRRMSVELREHYDLLKRQRDDLLRLQLQKERLMAFVVHDLKNPVNSMDLHAQVVLREKGLPANVTESVSQIRREARQLTRMILNLLDVSKADEGKLTPKRVRVNVRPFIEDILAELRVTAQDRKVLLRASIETDTMLADEDLLRRTLANLIENAIRHAPPATQVTVSATAPGGETEIKISDAGKGIPSEMRDKVFDPFVQLEAGDRGVSRSGRGLGLSFSKLAVEAHGGRIWIEDANPGTLVRLRFPGGDDDRVEKAAIRK